MPPAIEPPALLAALCATALRRYPCKNPCDCDRTYHRKLKRRYATKKMYTGSCDALASSVNLDAKEGLQ
jgi:hypothetical protein